MHHIVSDGWSMGIMVREFGQLYGARVGGAERVAAAGTEAAVWGLCGVAAGVVAGGGAGGAVEVLEEAVGGSGAAGAADGLCEAGGGRARGEGEVELRLERELSGKLKEMSRREGVTLFMSAAGGRCRWC